MVWFSLGIWAERLTVVVVSELSKSTAVAGRVAALFWVVVT